MGSDPDWHTTWREGRINFHEGKVNTYLERHADRLAGKRRVLVPLCGKSEDLAFLASRGHEVLGVELVEDAVRAFFDEHGLTPQVEPRGAFVAYTSGPITLLAGDFFALDHATAGDLDALYDRAALVAFDPETRPRYVTHLRGVLAPASAGLVVTLEFTIEGWKSPPYSVIESELRALYAGATIELLDEGPTSLLREGAPTLTERCFSVRF